MKVAAAALVAAIVLVPNLYARTPSECLAALKRAYADINSKHIDAYNSMHKAGRDLRVNIDKMIDDAEPLAKFNAGMGKTAYDRREALTLLPPEIIQVINYKIYRSYLEGRQDARDGYERAHTDIFTWMTTDYVFDGVWAITPFTGSADRASAEARIEANRKTADQVLTEARAFLAEQGNFFEKKVWLGLKKKTYVKSEVLPRWRDLQTRFREAMKKYADEAILLVVAAKGETQKALAEHYAAYKAKRLLAFFSVRVYLEAELPNELYRTAGGLFVAAYNAGYSRVGSYNWHGYDTEPPSNYGWDDGYNTTGRIFRRGNKLPASQPGDDYFPNQGSYDTKPGKYDTEPGSAYDTLPGSGSYDTQPGHSGGSGGVAGDDY